MKSDFQIQQDIIAEMKWDPALNANEIAVSVKNGVVTLSGIVDRYGKKITAEKSAKRIKDVRAVAMDIQVGVSPVFKKTDSEIAEMILTALRLHTVVQEDKIRIRVEDGNVTLEGSVEWDYQRKAAISAVENLPGVRNVINLIILRPQTPLINDVERKIRSAFHRRAELDAENITVHVTGNKVLLKGIVSSMKEKEAAEEAVWSAPGVTQLVNKLVVEEMALVL